MDRIAIVGTNDREREKKEREREGNKGLKWFNDKVREVKRREMERERIGWHRFRYSKEGLSYPDINNVLMVSF